MIPNACCIRLLIGFNKEGAELLLMDGQGGSVIKLDAIVLVLSQKLTDKIKSRILHKHSNLLILKQIILSLTPLGLDAPHKVQPILVSLKL